MAPGGVPVMGPGAVVWFTGLPSSGKSTIARALYDRLLKRGVAAELLDGSEVRESLSRGLGFSREDREEHVRRMGYVAKLLSRNGVIAICAAVSPYRSTRDEVRRNTTNFLEVYIDCPAEVAEERDSEGWYARARQGEVPEFTGVNGPYEPPLTPEVHIRSDVETVERAVALVERALPAAAAADQVATDLELRRRLQARGHI